MEERKVFLKTLKTELGLPHTIKRNDIYNSVIRLYTDDNVIKEDPFHVQFSGELAVDIGGVSRDMFSAFFDEMYLKMLDGSSLLYPAIHSSIGINDFKVIGLIISHAYLVSGMLPDRVAFPCLATVLLDQHVPDSVLLDSYIKSLCDYDMKVVQKALDLTDYSSDISSDLISLLSAHGCREIANPSNVRRLLCQVARYTFLIKPAAALSIMRQGIPEQHVPFWNAVPLEQFMSLYNAMSISVAKVQNLVEEPEFLNAAEEEVWLLLRKFIGNRVCQIFVLSSGLLQEV